MKLSWLDGFLVACFAIGLVGTCAELGATAVPMPTPPEPTIGDLLDEEADYARVYAQHKADDGYKFGLRVEAQDGTKQRLVFCMHQDPAKRYYAWPVTLIDISDEPGVPTP